MENRELKKNTPVELEDDVLGNVSGGVMSGSMLRSSITNTAICANGNGVGDPSGFEGMELFPVGAITEA